MSEMAIFFMMDIFSFFTFGSEFEFPILLSF
jgi:hypothetical protein